MTDIAIHQAANGAVEIRLDTGRDTVWLSQRQMAEIFGAKPDNVGLHLKKIFRTRSYMNLQLPRISRGFAGKANER